MGVQKLSLEVNDDSIIPKYKQVIDSIISNIKSGKITYGQKLPSINQLSFEYYLSRDTVEKAYRYLKQDGIINSIKSKGYYVSNTTPESRVKVLVIFNKLSAYKRVIYNSLAHALGEKAQIDFFIYHLDYQLFERIINEHLEGYHYYVIMPHFIKYDRPSLLKLLQKINSDKLIIMDRRIDGLENYYGGVYQDFKMDIYNAMEEALELLQKYRKLILVFPDRKSYPYPYPEEIVAGFKRFCSFNQFKFEVIDEVTENMSIEKGAAYVVIEENDLVQLIKHIRSQKLQLASDVGILSYNDTPLKEVLAEGITVITTDFTKMGELAAEMILKESPGVIKNDFLLVKRKSL